MIKKNKHFDIYAFLKKRPLSWSAMSSFEYDPEQWYRRYFLNEEQAPSAEMLFGKKFADACEARKPLAPVTLLCKMEQPFKVVFNKVPLVGYADTYCQKTKAHIGEYKTGKMKSTGADSWDQKRVDEHGQITMYALMNYITNKKKPEDCKFFLEWVPTVQAGDFSIDLLKPVKVYHFDTKRTMRDILDFGARINRTVKAMQDYVRNHE